MDEAKQRELRPAETHARLTAEFAAAGLDTSAFGFYDQPAFIEAEARDPTYLERYAEWVASRPLDPDYEAHVRAIVPKLAALVAAALAADDLQGGCITAYSLLTRMLDRLRIWSFGVIGSANLEVPHLGITRSLHTMDFGDDTDAIRGHAWVCAPPFAVVDPSLALQHWTGTPMAGRVPAVVLADGTAPMIRPTVEDCASVAVRRHIAAQEGRADPQLHHRLDPRLAEFWSRFPAREVRLDALRVRYVPIAIKQTDVPLELVNGSGRKGRSGAVIWEEIAPAFGL